MTWREAEREERRSIRGRARKLTDAEVQRIRSIYVGSEVTQAALAQRFGVSISVILRALEGVTRESAQ